MDIKDVKENKQFLTENLEVLLRDFEQLNRVRIKTIIILRANVGNPTDMITGVLIDVEI